MQYKTTGRQPAYFTTCLLLVEFLEPDSLSNIVTYTLHIIAHYHHQGKLCPLLLSDQFAADYNPAKEISVDQAMIPFKGRSSLNQYLALKPIKRGIKVWMPADAVEDMYRHFKFIQGKKGNDTEKALGSKVIKHLTEELQNTY